MMRSLYSGISGLRIVNQTKMDVIGNNIANVNTVGFKAKQGSFLGYLLSDNPRCHRPRRFHRGSRTEWHADWS